MEYFLSITRLGGLKNMDKIYKVTTTLIITYSALLFLLGIFVLGSYYFYFDSSFVESIFTGLVDIDIWLLNWSFIAYLCISSGLLGVYLGCLIWKNKAGADRLWLLFAAWLIAINSIHIGQYSFGEPDTISIAIISCLFLASWFTYRNKKLGAFTILRRNPFAEFFVFFVVLTQLSGILLVGGIEDPNRPVVPLTDTVIETLTTENVKEYFEKKMTQEMKQEMFGKLPEQYEQFYEFFEQKDGSSLRKLGESLLNNGYQNDKFILATLGIEYYAEGDLSKALDYLERALEGGYSTELLKPSSEEMIHFENAQIHYMLYLVLTEQGYSEKAQAEYKKSDELFKKVRSAKTYNKYIAKWEDMSKNVLNHFKNEQQ
jgi:tetratricopeptide (TPR) repeat protein